MKSRKIPLGGLLTAAGIISLLAGLQQCPQAQSQRRQADLQIETVGKFDQLPPRGIAISRDGRIFLSFPRGQKPADYTVAELKEGKTSPYPDAQLNRLDLVHPQQVLVSATSMAIDSKNRLWILDNGRVGRTAVPGAAKILAIQIETGAVIKTIPLDKEVMTPDTMLCDLEIYLSRGTPETAIISASSLRGANGFIVTDLATGKSMRRLNQHASVSPESNYVVFAEGRMVRLGNKEDAKQDWTPGVFGLAINAKRDKLYYSSVASQQIFQVDLDKLCNPRVAETDVEKTVKRLGFKAAPSTGMECDNKDTLYLADIEHSAIWRRLANGELEMVARGDQLSYPDHLCLGNDGYLYVTSSQFHRSPWFHAGHDERVPPFELLRVPVAANNSPTMSPGSQAQEASSSKAKP